MSVILLAKFTVFLTVLLGALLAGVRWHMQSPLGFALATSVCTPIAAALCVKLSHDTWWYAHGMATCGVPLWLFPMHGLFAHWVLDAYWLVTLKDVRKTTLP